MIHVHIVASMVLFLTYRNKEHGEILTLANERTIVAMKCPATFVSRIRPVTKEWSFFSAD
jgi:hypothetical protein